MRQASNGSCTGAPVDLSAGANYLIAENDFIAAGGDSYPDFSNRAIVRDAMHSVTAVWINANSPISPALQGRIVCTSSGATLCPILLP